MRLLRIYCWVLIRIAEPLLFLSSNKFSGSDKNGFHRVKIVGRNTTKLNFDLPKTKMLDLSVVKLSVGISELQNRCYFHLSSFSDR